MRLRRFTAGMALAMSLAMSVTAFADGSITGVIESAQVVIGEDTELPEDADLETLEIIEEFEANYFLTDEKGIEAKETFEALNDGTTTLTEAVPELAEELKDLGMLTEMQAVVIRDEDGNIIEDGKNVSISFELTNIPDNTDIYALLYDATNGYTLQQLKNGSVLGDSIIGEGAEAPTVKAGAVLADVVRGKLEGSRVTLTFGDLKGAAFTILYKKADSNGSSSVGGNTSNSTGTTDSNTGATGTTDSSTGATGTTDGSTSTSTNGATSGNDNASADTGNASRALPIALAAIVAGSAVVVSRKKRA